MNKKLVSILLLLCFLLCFAFPVYAEESAEDTATTEETAPAEELPSEELPAVELSISNIEEFLAFAENCRLDRYSQNLIVYLEADVDLTNTKFESIPIFCGIFEGNGHTISGLDVSSHGSQVGLFRRLTLTAVVRDLNVVGQVTPQGSRSNIGGIAGENAGRIENCTFTGTVSGGDWVGGIAGVNAFTGIIESCTTSGSIHGNHFVGGIAGENAGVVRSCTNTAEINTTAQQNNVDLSEITMDTLTGAESANTVTDIGGIAGTSSGMIHDCKNLGAVGYKQMGYNIGGIAGSHSGYIANCENHAAISGRKEVGGIVGQMEPFILLRYDTDTLQLLRAEFSVLTDLVDRTSLNAEENTATTQSLLWTLQYYVSQIENSLSGIRIDPENPEQLDPDSIIASVQSLRNSINGISYTLQNLTYALGNTTSELTEDLKAVRNQLDVINGILDDSEENLGGSVTDVSDADTAEDMSSKIERCINHGSVLADLNGGGIVGAIALENDLDPEDDVQINGSTTLNAAGQLRSVVIGCFNHGSIDVRKQNAGGIVGWQSMGLVQNCLNSGDLIAEATDYVGGITGRGQGYIRGCSVRCTVIGDAFVGGIAGSGTNVSDCRSLVQLVGTERTGAILGFAEESNSDNPIQDNFYFPVANDPGAIDGTSYAGQAEPLERTEFLALENLPELFQYVTITFFFEDRTAQTHSISLGDGLEASVIPAVPQKTGFSGVWNGLEGTDLATVYFDQSFHLVYTSHDTVIQSAAARGKRPVLLVQGDFAPNATVTIFNCEDAPVLTEEELLLEIQQFAVTDYTAITTGRFLITSGHEKEILTLYVRNDGVWKAVPYTIDGSYLVFGLTPGDDAIALSQTEKTIEDMLPWIAGIGAVILIAAIVLVFWNRAAKKRKNTAAPTVSETK